MSDFLLEKESKASQSDKGILEREWELLCSIPQNVIGGIKERCSEIAHDPLSVMPEILGSACVGGLIAYATKNPIALTKMMQGTKFLAHLATSPQILAANARWLAPRAGLGLITLDMGNRFLQPMWDTAHNPKNLEIDKRWLGKNLGSAVVDYPLMSVAGYAGAKSIDLAPSIIGSPFKGKLSPKVTSQPVFETKSSQAPSMKHPDVIETKIQTTEVNSSTQIGTSSKADTAATSNQNENLTLAEERGWRRYYLSSKDLTPEDKDFIAKIDDYHYRMEDIRETVPADSQYAKLEDLAQEFQCQKLTEQLEKFVPLVKTLPKNGTQLWDPCEAPAVFQELAEGCDAPRWIAYVGPDAVDSNALSSLLLQQENHAKTVHLPNGGRLEVGAH